MMQLDITRATHRHDNVFLPEFIVACTNEKSERMIKRPVLPVIDRHRLCNNNEDGTLISDDFQTDFRQPHKKTKLPTLKY